MSRLDSPHSLAPAGFRCTSCGRLSHEPSGNCEHKTPEPLYSRPALATRLRGLNPWERPTSGYLTTEDAARIVEQA